MFTKVRSLFKVGKQTAGCSNFCTETRLHRPVSVRNSVHPAVCLPSLKRERTLYIMEQIKIILENIFIYNVIQLIISKSNDNYLTAFLCQNNSIRIPDEKWQDLTNQNNLFTNKHICLQRNSVHYFKWQESNCFQIISSKHFAFIDFIMYMPVSFQSSSWILVITSQCLKT